jgi:hypothetical protein
VNDAYAGNTFGRYLGEILCAEGLNGFDVIDLSAMTAAELNQHDLAILAETPLTSAQAATLTTYVSGGGRLIAMRPDAQITALFGLGAAAGTLTDGYLKIDGTAVLNGSAPGQGLTTTTLQIHGLANQYALSGGVMLARLYSNANASTTYPAVVGSASGQTAAFTYDLARNVVYTRQGNPANANKIYGSPLVADSQGILGTWDTANPPVTRTTSLFQLSNVLTAPAWIDRDRIPIPQADEQQRLFARLIKQLVAQAHPLPQLWYFPDAAKTMLILTGDAHANPESYYQNEINSLNTYGGKLTFYLSTGGGVLDNAVLQGWRAQGYEFGIHPYANNPNLATGYSVSDGAFAFYYTSPKSRTVRNHQVAWQGWTDAADIAIAHGIAMDTSFYHWGAWLQKADGSWPHGYLTGSGQPMKFIKVDGTILPEYQQLTELVDEQLFSLSYPGEQLSSSQAIAVSQQLMDASLAGDYAALTTQFHVDYYGFGYPQDWAEGTMAYANAHGIPIWNADRWLSFTETRHDSNYTNVTWNNGTQTLAFSQTATTTVGITLTTMVPLDYGGHSLVSVTVDGLPHAYSAQTVKGVNVAFVSVPAGSHSFSAVYQVGTPTETATVTNTPTSSATPTLSATPTNGPTPTSTSTGTATPTRTATALATATATPTSGPANTATATPTRTATAAATATATPTRTATTPPPATATPTATSSSAPTTVTLTAQVAASSDDANQDGSSLSLTSATLWLGNAASTTSSYTGLRFASLALPAGATINSARLQVYSSQTQWLSLSLSIAADATGNSPTFSASNLPSQRTLTTQKVAHSSNVQWQANTWYTLDEMALVVQEVVNRGDWQSGNSLSVILKGTGGAWGRKFVASFDGSAATAPKLVITYTTASGATSTPTLPPTPTLTRTPTATRTATPTASMTATPTDTATSLPLSTATATATNTPILTASPTPTQTATDVAGSPVSFPVGVGGSDVVPRQIVRTSDDRVYLFANQQYSTYLRAYWTTAAGLPNAQVDFAGSASVTDSANPISVDAVYGGGSLIHVLVNTQGGQLKDYPFDTMANVFKPAITLASNNRTVSGDYAGSCGVSGIVDQSGTLHVAYWATGDHIVHVAYTYDSGANTLAQVSAPTQLDVQGVVANHPSIAVSPLDNSLTVAWVSQSSPAKILARTRTSAGIWGGVEIVSTGSVWTNSNFGVNIDQGPSLVIASDGAKHLVYIENWDGSGDYGRVHYVLNTGSGWTDQALGTYTHDPAIATTNAGNFYIIGHGHPKNMIAYGGGSPCLDMRDMCYLKKNGDGTWGAPQLLIAHTDTSESFDASVSVKWGVVGWNRPETVEFVFFSVLNNDYGNPTLYYARIP